MMFHIETIFIYFIYYFLNAPEYIVIDQLNTMNIVLCLFKLYYYDYVHNDFISNNIIKNYIIIIHR